MNRTLAGILSVSAVLSGCAADGSSRPFTHMESGAMIGAAGGAVGAYMDSQKRDLEKNLAKEIQAGQARVEKLSEQVVRITMTSQTAFDTDSSAIKPGFHSTMDKVADVVVRYGKTTLTIVGHTDNVGTDEYNQQLSQRRALSVAQYLESRRVDALRLATAGKGETQPAASNASESGRQANRRVEIYVEAVVQG